jgi:hypothetical protein
MGLAMKLYLGRSPSSEPVRRQAKTLIGLNPPEYNSKWDKDRKGSKTDFYYYYHGTLAFHRLGGEEWDKWKKALIDALEDCQATKGQHVGSWPLYNLQIRSGGRIFSTAAALLALEACYRYP